MSPADDGGPAALLANALIDAFGTAESVLERHEARPRVREVGVVTSVSRGVVTVSGLSGIGAEELVRFPDGQLGLAFNLDPGQVGVVMLDLVEGVDAGDEVRRTGRVFEVPVGEGLLGRVVDAAGRPRDEAGRVLSERTRGVEQPAPPITHRGPVETPLQTGLKVVDALTPIGRGQRQLIMGDRGTGKTSVAVDTILNQRGTDVRCVYCAVGQRNSSVARVIEELRRNGALTYCTVVVASGEDPPGLQFVAPYAATSMAEQFLEEGRDVLVVYDDLTRHARAYRELSLLLERPPGREAYPGDVFYLHARLLERATRLRPERGGGSMTALPIVETEAQNLAAYIPTNLISITDGQTYLSPTLHQKGILPAVDVTRSVSRVGGRAQLPAYRAVVADLRLAYAQFLELEVFSRFATELDEETRRALERGRRVREILTQPRGAPVGPAEQVAVLLAATAGVLDQVPLENVARAEERVREAVRERASDLCRRIEEGAPLEGTDRDELRSLAETAVADLATA